MRCRIDGSLLRVILQTSTFSLYTCVAAGHTTRTGAPPPTGPTYDRAIARPLANKPLDACDYGKCLEPKAPGVEFCEFHREAVRAQTRKRYVPKRRKIVAKHPPSQP